VAHAAHDHPRLDPRLCASVVDPLREAGEVLLVGDPDVGGVVGRGRELDVDRALRRTAEEVLVDDVVVVLARTDDARGAVVDLEEVEEVVPVEPAVVGDHAVGHADAVARGDPLDQVGGRRPLDVDVQLGLGDAHAVAARCWNGSFIVPTLSGST